MVRQTHSPPIFGNLTAYILIFIASVSLLFVGTGADRFFVTASVPGAVVIAISLLSFAFILGGVAGLHRIAFQLWRTLANQLSYTILSACNLAKTSYRRMRQTSVGGPLIYQTMGRLCPST